MSPRKKRFTVIGLALLCVLAASAWLAWSPAMLWLAKRDAAKKYADMQDVPDGEAVGGVEVAQQASAQAGYLLTDALRDAKTDEERQRVASQLVALGRPGLEACSRALANPHQRTSDVAAMALLQAGQAGQDILIAAVASDNLLGRRRAIAALETNPPPRAAKTLIARLEHRGDWQRPLGRAIVRIGKPAVPGLVAVMEANDAQRQAVAAKLLGQIGDPSAAEPLAQLVGNEDYFVRSNVTEALRQFGDRTVDLVSPKLHEGARARAHAIEVLAATRSSGAARLLVACTMEEGKSDMGLDRLIVGMGSVAVDPLIARLDQEPVYLARRCARLLAQIDDPRVVAPILCRGEKLQEAGTDALDMLASKPKLVEGPALTLLADAHQTPQSRRFAAYVLGKAGAKAAVEPLLRLIAEMSADNDALRQARQEAVTALGRIGDKRAAKPLMALLDTPGYQEVTIRALGELQATEATDELIRRLRANPSWYQQATLITALGKLKADGAVPLIRVAFKQYPRVLEVGEAATLALESIGNDAALEALADLFASNWPGVRAEALKAAVTINPAGAVTYIERLADDGSFEVQMTRAWACQKLDKSKGIELARQIAAKSPVVDAKCRAIAYLAQYDQDSAPFLRKLYKADKDTAAANALLGALCTLKDTSAMPIFIEAAARPAIRTRALRAIAAVGDESALPLLQKYKAEAKAEMDRNRTSMTILVFAEARDALDALQSRLRKQATSQPEQMPTSIPRATGN